MSTYKKFSLSPVVLSHPVLLYARLVLKLVTSFLRQLSSHQR